ncbi:hypothetical protein KY289_005286 [Solanum tuberosum]|nr:hypothetical protein KY289_005286 [Solanum tuberosum]
MHSKEVEKEGTSYVKKAKDGDVLVVSLYVDDLLLTGSNDAIVNQFKQEMEIKLEMYYLDSRWRGASLYRPCWFHNEKISKFEGGDKADRTVYGSIIGSLLFLTTTRPDLMFATSLLSRFIQALSQVDLGVAKL